VHYHTISDLFVVGIRTVYLIKHFYKVILQQAYSRFYCHSSASVMESTAFCWVCDAMINMFSGPMCLGLYKQKYHYGTLIPIRI